MTTAAITGAGTVLKRGPVLTAVAVGEIESITGPSKKKASIDATTLNSADGYREFINGFKESGTVVLAMNFTADEYSAMNDDFESGENIQYQIIFPDTPTTTFAFMGSVTDLGVSIPLDNKITCSVTIKISGKVTVS